MTKRLTPGSRPRRDGWEFQECYSHTRDINIDIPLLLNQEIVCWQRSITLTACFFLKLKYGVLCLASFVVIWDKDWCGIDSDSNICKRD